MFQNISRSEENVSDEDVKVNIDKQDKLIAILKNTFTIQNCIIYVLTFMMSLVGGLFENSTITIAPFAIAMVAASVGAGIPAVMVTAMSLVGTGIKYGANGLLINGCILLIFLVSILIKRPEEQEDRNEKKKVGIYISISAFVVQIIKLFIGDFLIYDLIYSVVTSILIFVLYKIFVNSFTVYKNIGERSVFSIEEVIGASLILVIAIQSLGNINILNFNIKNILTILIVLVLGWKNGMLIGAASGVTIGVTVGIIGSTDPIMIATYAVSGLLAGLLNRLGKFGVIVGFILGNVILSYISNGNSIPTMRYQEILIAALGLLAIPKSSGLKVSDLIEKEKLLPETTGRTLEENKETVSKLKNMSNTLSDIAKEYAGVSATIVEDKNKEETKTNKEIFIDELQVSLQGKEENLLYNDIYDNNNDILTEIFDILLEKEVITKLDIIQIFASHNNYIIGISDDKDSNESAQDNIEEIVRVINSSYRISKLNFVWKKKLENNKKNMSTQLSGVSEAISNLAEDIRIKEINQYEEKKKEIIELLKEKDVNINDIKIKKDDTGRFFVTVYTNICDEIDGKNCSYKKIEKVVGKVLGEEIEIQKQKCGLRKESDNCMFEYITKDQYSMQVGIAKSKKADSIISGDSTIQTKLEDGKYLLAISDGMGSGPEARKSSKIAIKMLERLLKTGFNKENALKLINTTISDNTEEDMYATLDASIIDLYKGNMELIKNGAAPTFIKRNKKVEILKAITLPAGILDNIDLVEYNEELQNGDIVLMCSDGILNSSEEYTNKELWIEYLLEDLETDDAQRIADIVLNESRDNNYGKEKDDMTVIAFRVDKKKI